MSDDHQSAARPCNVVIVKPASSGSSINEKNTNQNDVKKKVSGERLFVSRNSSQTSNKINFPSRNMSGNRIKGRIKRHFYDLSATSSGVKASISCNSLTPDVHDEANESFNLISQQRFPSSASFLSVLSKFSSKKSSQLFSFSSYFIIFRNKKLFNLFSKILRIIPIKYIPQPDNVK